MYDAASRSDLHPELQRARGALRVSFKRRDQRTVLETLRQEGCLKARFPRAEPRAWTGMVTLNSSGGIAGGDLLETEIRVGEGARATIASQAAERFYRALPDLAPARLRNRMEIASGGAGEWLPQESILFDRCMLDRRLDVTLAADAWFLGVEALVFGRAAMGETVERGWLRDTISVRRDGRLVLHDAIRLDGAIADRLARPAIMAGGRGLATIVHAAPDADRRLDALRGAFEGCEAECGASAWDGLLVGRIVAPDGARLRAAVIAGLAALRAERPLPRVWLC